MAARDYQVCEDRVLDHEGSVYTDGVHPYDPGGPTRWGITLTDARAFWKPNATARDVMIMPKSVAQLIYKHKYWDFVRGDDLPAGVDDVIFDYGILSGNSRAGKVLRRVLGMSDADWHVTDEVIAACAKRDPNQIIDAISDERLQFMRGLSIWPTYKNGWTTRVREVRQFAKTLTSAKTPALPKITTGIGNGKAMHPQVNTTKTVVTGVGGTAATTAGLWAWVGAHPVVAIGCIALGVAVVIGVVYLLQSARDRKQDAPTAGLVPVPAK